jgi:NADH-quinone oxidoreductase subunit J
MSVEPTTGWQGVNIAFWVITLVVIPSACVAALSRSIVQAAFALFFTLLGIAGYYVLLGSGILLTNRPLQRDQRDSPALYAVGATVGLLLLALIESIIVLVPWPMATVLSEPASDVRPLGRLLITKYLLPFELAGMTLLLCLVGAAYLVRRRER